MSCLAWHPDEAPRLDRAEMLRAADAALAVIDAAHLQCVIVCHRDQPHPHVHCVVPRSRGGAGTMSLIRRASLPLAYFVEIGSSAIVQVCRTPA